MVMLDSLLTGTSHGDAYLCTTLAQGWLLQAVDRGDLIRILEPLLIMLTHPDSARSQCRQIFIVIIKVSILWVHSITPHLNPYSQAALVKVEARWGRTYLKTKDATLRSGSVKAPEASDRQTDRQTNLRHIVIRLGSDVVLEFGSEFVSLFFFTQTWTLVIRARTHWIYAQHNLELSKKIMRFFICWRNYCIFYLYFVHLDRTHTGRHVMLELTVDWSSY